MSKVSPSTTSTTFAGREGDRHGPSARTGPVSGEATSLVGLADGGASSDVQPASSTSPTATAAHRISTTVGRSGDRRGE